MRTNYDRQLKKLNDEMVEMGSMIEGVIEKAIKALVNQDVDLAQEVIRRDNQIDQQDDVSFELGGIHCGVGFRVIHNLLLYFPGIKPSFCMTGITNSRLISL